MKTVTGVNRVDLESTARPSLVMLGASWCTYCRPLKPQVAKVSIDRDDLDVYYVDIDNDPSIAQELDVMSIPKLYLVHENEWIEISGRSSQAIKEEINGVIYDRER